MYREAESLDDWFKGTYSARAYRVECGGRECKRTAFCEMLGSTNAYMRVIGCGDGELEVIFRGVVWYVECTGRLVVQDLCQVPVFIR